MVVLFCEFATQNDIVKIVYGFEKTVIVTSVGGITNKKQGMKGVTMIGICFVCFIIFPITVFANAHKAYPAEAFLDKQDANVVKGVATCFVILAHLTIQLETMGEYNRMLHLVTTMGGMGVLLFFFVSGYGLYNGYKDKKVDVTFWKKRLVNMYFPCMLIQLTFFLVEALPTSSFNVLNMISYSLCGAWFIDVILVQYLIFFITWKITKGKPNAWIALSFLSSIIVAIVFMKCGFNARWYNGLMLFPFGMLIANKEKQLITIIEKKWNTFLLITMILFIISGMVFTYFKGSVMGIDLIKTFSGMCLSMLVCIGFLRIKLCSPIMLYIGKKSLYFYLVHVNLLSILRAIEEIKGVSIFYMVLGLTFPIVEIFYQLRFRDRKILKRHFDY